MVLADTLGWEIRRGRHTLARSFICENYPCEYLSLRKLIAAKFYQLRYTFFYHKTLNSAQSGVSYQIAEK